MAESENVTIEELIAQFERLAADDGTFGVDDNAGKVLQAMIDRPPTNQAVANALLARLLLALLEDRAQLLELVGGTLNLLRRRLP